MGKSWDGTGAVHSASFWESMLRVLRPGGFAVVWALPRTSHWTAVALEKAGFEIRDVHHDVLSSDEVLRDFIDLLDAQQLNALARVLELGVVAPVLYHFCGSGFPKSLNISKAIGEDSPEAARWTGYGTALKPSVEHWILARKPLSGTYADNVLAHGTGALNIDACRIGYSADGPPPSVYSGAKGQSTAVHDTVYGDSQKYQSRVSSIGRWPAHLSLRHAPGCVPTGETTTEQVQTFSNAGEEHRDGDESTNFAMGRQVAGAPAELSREVYRCAPGCPVAELDAQSGTLKSGARRAGVRQGHRDGTVYAAGHRGDGGPALEASTGGASRFFLTVPPFRYVAKPSRREKDLGLAHLKATSGGEATDREDGSAGLQSPRAGAGRTGGAKNPHPTVKSIELMKWLIRLVVPDPKTLGRPGVVLDPFAGSGSTGVAALALGHDFVGSELTDEYLPALVGRIRFALGLPPDGESK